MMADQHQDDDEDAENLYCTICEHNLNHHAYKICEHPNLPVAICLICSDALAEREAEAEKNGDLKELCDWCLDGGDIFICGDGSQCSHQFCSDCLTRALGVDYVEEIREKDMWRCLACDSSPLTSMTASMRDGQARSLFHLVDEALPPTEGMTAEELHDKKMDLYISLIQVMVEEAEDASARLESARMDEVEMEVRKDFASTMPAHCSIAHKLEVEMETYCERWRRHLDIMQHQEALLVEIVDGSGYNLRAIPCYHIPELGEEDMYRVVERSQAELKISARDNGAAPVVENDSSSDENMSDDEEDEKASQLEALVKRAAADVLIQSYANEEVPPSRSYPKAFDKLLPKAVLTALSHATSGDIEEISRRFLVPRHVALVMSSVFELYPRSTDSWRFAQNVHRSVRKALFYSKNAIDQAVLCDHYDLDAGECIVTDIGASEDLLSIHHQHKESAGSRVGGLTLKLMREAVQSENKYLDAHLATLRGHASERSKQGKVASYERSVLSNNSNRSFAHDDVANEEDDLVELQSERNNAIHSIGSSRRARTRRMSKSVVRELPSAPVDLNRGCTIKKESVVELADDSMEVSEDIRPSRDIAMRNPVAMDQVEEGEDMAMEEEEDDDNLVIKKTRNITKVRKLISPVKSDKNTSPKGNASDVIDLTLDEDDEVEEEEEEDVKIVSSSKKSVSTGGGVQSSIAKFWTPSSKTKSLPNADADLNDEDNFWKPVVNRKKLIKNNDHIETNGDFEDYFFGSKQCQAFDPRNHFDDTQGTLVNQEHAMNEEPVMLIQSYVPKLKPHQIEAVRFIWKNVMKSIASCKKEHPKHAGCIIAHCMGLGKTFTVVAFTMTMFTNPVITNLADPYQPNLLSFEKQGKDPSPPKKVLHRALVVAPKNTIQNWKLEFQKWTPPDILRMVNVDVIDAGNGCDTAKERVKKLTQWYKNGGIMILSYDLFRKLVGTGEEKVKNDDLRVQVSCLLDPGPDLVIADEAHYIKESTSQINKALSRIRTKRRIALTGSPLQNNLIEYYTMVDWVKKLHLYSPKRYKDTFVSVITKGQSKNSDSASLLAMKKRIHVLHKRLTPIVDRKDTSELLKVLPPKREFILTIKMTPFQKFLYQLFLSKLKRPGNGATKKINFLFSAYQALLRVWNHPACTVMNSLMNPSSPTKKKVAPASINFTRIKSSLLDTYKYFKSLDKKGLDEVEARAANVESQMAKDNPSILAASSESVIPNGGIESEESEIENDSEGDDLDGFVVGDDVVEYESGHSGNESMDDGSDHDDDEDGNYSESSKTKKRRSSSRTGAGSKKKSRTDSPQSEVENDAVPAEGGDLVTADDDMDEAELLRNSPTNTACSTTPSVRCTPTLPVVSSSPPSIPLLAGDGGAPQSVDEVEEAEENLVGADWWKQDAPTDSDIKLSDGDMVCLSNKIVAFLFMLAFSVEQGDKMLLFTQSLFVLDLIEHTLRLPRWAKMVGAHINSTNSCSNWTRDREFLRIDGSINQRQAIIDKFNTKFSVKLMLISTKAGNMGINLQAANRVVIFDTSWNPVHDLQAIYRAYRFGQEKSVFVYRLVAAGTMEQQIYKRQVTKQALSARVVDNQMPENHFSDAEQAELLTFDPDDKENLAKAMETLKSGTQDYVLTKLMETAFGPEIISQIEDHDSFLADRSDAHLNEDERKAAEEEFEKESKYYKAMDRMRAGQIAAVQAAAAANRAAALAGTGAAVGPARIINQPSVPTAQPAADDGNVA